MIIVNLKGGTGNQLFQYALGRHLAIKNKDTLKFDVSGLARAKQVGDVYRPLALNLLAVKVDLATEAEVKKIKYHFGLLSKAWLFIKTKILRQFNIIFNPKYLDLRGDVYLDGFWQSPLYFEAIREVLVKELTLNKLMSGEALAYQVQIQNTNSISLHIRRGDYTKNRRVKKEYGSCSPTYYEQAVAQIKKTVPSPTFFIFSDDIAWVKTNQTINEKIVFIEAKEVTDIEEVLLMSQCQHNIIANSSFSWWGAWLNQNLDKIVIAPTPWFNKSTYDKNLIPLTWIQLPK